MREPDLLSLLDKRLAGWFLYFGESYTTYQRVVTGLVEEGALRFVKAKMKDNDKTLT